LLPSGDARLCELLAQGEEVRPASGIFEVVASDQLNGHLRQPNEFFLGDIDRAERAFAQLRFHRVGEHISWVLIRDDALDVVALQPRQQRAKAPGGIGQQDRWTDAIHRHRRGIGLELRVRDGVELVVARAVRLFERGWIVHRKLKPGIEFAVSGPEPPSPEVALIAPCLRLVGVVLATPVRPSHTRAVPHVGRIAGTQQLRLVSLAAVPATLPDGCARTVPQDQGGRLRFDGYLIFDMAMVAGQRRRCRIADDPATGFERALPRDGDRALRQLGHARIRAAGQQQPGRQPQGRPPFREMPHACSPSNFLSKLAANAAPARRLSSLSQIASLAPIADAASRSASTSFAGGSGGMNWIESIAETMATRWPLWSRTGVLTALMPRTTSCGASAHPRAATVVSSRRKSSRAVMVYGVNWVSLPPGNRPLRSRRSARRSLPAAVE